MEFNVSGLDKERGKALLVFVAVCLQGALVYSCSVLSSSFYVTHLVNRGIPEMQVGLIGMIPAFGHLLNAIYDILEYLLHVRKFSLHTVQCSVMALLIVNCAGQGLAEYLPTEYNQLLTVILMLQRLVLGVLSFISCKTAVTSCRVWFPDHFNLIVGLYMSSDYLGGGLSILISGYVYQAHSFNEPYFVVSLICVAFWLYNFFIMPRTSDPVYRKAQAEEVNHENGQSNKRDMTSQKSNSDEQCENGLSWLVIFPLVGKGLTAMIEGYASAITTPYLQDKFAMETGQGSTYVTVMFVSFIIGSAGAGYILQMGWVSNFNTMIVGALLSTIGLFLIFPGQHLWGLFDIVPKLAYAGTFFIGLGTQLISIAALPALEETQVTLAKRRFTRKNKSQASSLWIISWMLSVYAGHLVALMVIKFMTYTQGCWLVAGCSGLSVCICAVLEVFARRSRARLVKPVE